MRGEVLHYDEAQGFGFITGADGNRYTFRREDMRRDGSVTKGTVVEFQASSGRATGVFAIRASASVPRAGTAAEPTLLDPVPSRIPPAADSQAGPPREATFGRSTPSIPARQIGPVFDAAPSTGLWGYFVRALTANYANFRGRARRKEYWGFYLFWMLSFAALMVLGAMVDGVLGNFDTGDGIPFLMVGLSGIFVVATFIPCLAMVVRRQHDIGLSGWFYLLVFIPYVGGLIIFVFSLIPSQMHENKWGPIPDGIRVPAPYAPPAA
jgi:uncharacterized membrane protein YhaH (DUF805 family)/cold shock CspA family protein